MTRHPRRPHRRHHLDPRRRRRSRSARTRNLRAHMNCRIAILRPCGPNAAPRPMPRPPHRPKPARHRPPPTSRCLRADVQRQRNRTRSHPARRFCARSSTLGGIAAQLKGDRAGVDRAGQHRVGDDRFHPTPRSSRPAAPHAANDHDGSRRRAAVHCERPTATGFVTATCQIWRKAPP